ncbi:hypothetical protein [Sulfitobacter aestuariivivens]|uniref:hypothetical protein n=1 Tax=Sulfitobacter aestuariivivens TaxID=2766981 RepID=UPI003605D587
MAELDLTLFDFHIAASFAAQHAICKHLANAGLSERPVGLVHHHADPRLAKIASRTENGFRAAYVGMPENATIPESLQSDVAVLHAKTGRDFGRILPELQKYTLHFAVRPPRDNATARGYKPFTKGFTAAACRANIMVNRSEDDAEHLLGADYPYFVEGASADAIENCFEDARSHYGGPVWKDARDRVQNMLELTRPDRLAGQLHEIIDTAVQTIGD